MVPIIQKISNATTFSSKYFLEKRGFWDDIWTKNFFQSIVNLAAKKYMSSPSSHQDGWLNPTHRYSFRQVIEKWTVSRRFTVSSSLSHVVNARTRHNYQYYISNALSIRKVCLLFNPKITFLINYICSNFKTKRKSSLGLVLHLRVLHSQS